MKKLIVLLVLVTTAGQISAQHKFWLGGKVGFDSYSDDNDLKQSEVNISPTVGYLFSNKLAAGLDLGFKFETEKEKFSQETITTKTNQISINPFIRYYCDPCETLRFYSQFHVGYAFGSTDISNIDTKDEWNAFNTGLSVGLLYGLCERWALEMEWGALNYEAFTDKGDFPGQEDFKSSEFSIGAKLSRIKVGGQFRF
jgi:hypothetical protein